MRRGPEQQMDSEFYLQARREWDARYGDLVLGKRNWQSAFAGLMLLSLVFAVGIVWVSARTTVIPYAVSGQPRLLAVEWPCGVPLIAT